MRTPSGFCSNPRRFSNSRAGDGCRLASRYVTALISSSRVDRLADAHQLADAVRPLEPFAQILGWAAPAPQRATRPAAAMAFIVCHVPVAPYSYPGFAAVVSCTVNASSSTRRFVEKRPACAL